MKKNYILTLSTTENEPVNKFYRIINQHEKDKLNNMNFIGFEYPTLNVSDTEENLNFLIDLLIENGFNVETKLKMIYDNASILTIKDFATLLGTISDGKVGVKCENGEWFYVVAEDSSNEEIQEMLRKSLGAPVNDVIIDITHDRVTIMY